MERSSQPAKVPASVASLYEIRLKDLPLSCPMQGMKIWNSHPKVYLPIEASGKWTCPYCSTHYVLVSDVD